MNLLHRLAFELTPAKKNYLNTVKYSVLWPLYLFIESLAQLRLKHRLIKQHFNVGTWQIFTESCYYAFFYNMPVKVYYMYMMWKAYRKEQVLSLINNFEMQLIFKLLYKDQDISHINDKNKFFDFC